MAFLAALPFAYRGMRVLREDVPFRNTALILVTGIGSACANLVFLAATGHGDLAVVAVRSAMYPAVTVLLVRLVLAEKSTFQQSLGLLAAAAAVILVDRLKHRSAPARPPAARNAAPGSRRRGTTGPDRWALVRSRSFTTARSPAYSR